MWKKKVEDWEKDLEQYEKLTQEQKRQYDALPNNFVVDRTKDKYKNQMEKALQQRCFSIYKHES